MLIPISMLAVFFSTSILLALAPGPDNIFVLTQSAVRGKLAGWIISLGLCTGLMCHTLLIASGVAVIFQTSSVAFTSLKLVGGAYLLYLSYLSFCSSSTTFLPLKNSKASLFQLYRRGIIMNMTNPKVSIFFLSFLPQFSDPSRGSLMLQIVSLGFVFVFSSLLVFCIISIIADSLGNHLQQSSRAQIIMNRIVGTVYVAIAMKLITAEI